MKLTKRIALLAIIFATFSYAQASSPTGGTIQMTKKMFTEKITDYKNSPNTWKYLGDKPCLIDFYTTWCGPCKRLAPILEELAKQYAGEIYIYKIDTEREPELAALFQVRSIPTLLFCPMEGGPQLNKGALPKEMLIEAIDGVLLKKAKTNPTKAEAIK